MVHKDKLVSVVNPVNLAMTDAQDNLVHKVLWVQEVHLVNQELEDNLVKWAHKVSKETKATVDSQVNLVLVARWV